MKKVLILVNHDVVIYNFRLELVQRLLSDGFQVYISSPYGERIDDLINLGCIYIKTELNRHGLNVFNELKLIKFYKRIISEVNPNIILTYTIKPNIYGTLAAKSFQIPVIATITGLGISIKNGGLMQKISINLYKYAFKTVSKIFFQNKDNKQFFMKNNIGSGKYRLVPGSGVNLNHFSLLKYPHDTTIEFIFISRIMREKGIEEYLEAATYIREKYPSTRFHILGFCEESYEQKLADLQEKGIIHYHGMQRDIRTFLKKTHCTIHPSYHEGMSNVLLESAASGRPIITTDINGCKEIVNDGESGYLIKVKDSQDLINKIEQFLKLSHDNKIKMGLEGRRKVEKEFDRNIVVEDYLDEIKNHL